MADVDLNPFRTGTLVLTDADTSALRQVARAFNAAPTAECAAFAQQMVAALSDASMTASFTALQRAPIMARVPADSAPSGLRSLLATLVDYAKCHTPSSAIKSALEDAGFASDRAEVLESALTSRMDAIRDVLMARGLRLPRLVDVRWNLEYVISASDVGRVGRPSYTISLILEEDGAPELRTHTFTCTPQELDDLYARVKEALRAAAAFAPAAATAASSRS